MTTLQTGADKDRLEAKRVEDRRARYDVIAERIHNVRQRVIGQDLQTLAIQIDEQKEKEARAKEIEYLDYKEACDIASTLSQLEMDKLRARKDKQRQINEFNLDNLKPEQRREFDLYDPDGVAKDRPVRTLNRGEDDYLPVSSGQVMDGEDLDKKAKDKAKAAALKEELDRQMIQKEEDERLERERIRLEAEEDNAIRSEVVRRTLEEEAARRDARREVENLNGRAVEMKREMQITQKALDDEMMAEHIKNYASSGFMAEDLRSGEFYGNPNRHNPAQYRGMLPGDIERLMKERTLHTEALEETRAKEKAEQEEELRQKAAIDRDMMLREREHRRQLRDKSRQYQETLLTQAAAQRGQATAINDVYENRLGDDFFDRMGKDWR